MSEVTIVPAHSPLLAVDLHGVTVKITHDAVVDATGDYDPAAVAAFFWSQLPDPSSMVLPAGFDPETDPEPALLSFANHELGWSVSIGRGGVEITGDVSREAGVLFQALADTVPA